MRQIDYERDDYDLTSEQTVLTYTPGLYRPYRYQAVLFVGDGSKDLDGSGGSFEIGVKIGDVYWYGAPVATSLASGITRTWWATGEFVVPSNATVYVTLKSPNGADTDVDVCVYLFDVLGVPENDESHMRYLRVTGTDNQDYDGYYYHCGQTSKGYPAWMRTSGDAWIYGTDDGYTLADADPRQTGAGYTDYATSGALVGRGPLLGEWNNSDGENGVGTPTVSDGTLTVTENAVSILEDTAALESRLTQPQQFAHYHVAPDSTDISLVVPLYGSAGFGLDPDVDIDGGNITLFIEYADGTFEYAPLSALPAPPAAHCNWSARHIRGGFYRLDVPDLAWNYGGDAVVLRLTDPDDNTIGGAQVSLRTAPTNAESAFEGFSGKLANWLRLLARADAAITNDAETELDAINDNLGSGGGSYTNQTLSQETIGLIAAALDSRLTAARAAKLDNYPYQVGPPGGVVRPGAFLNGDALPMWTDAPISGSIEVYDHGNPRQPIDLRGKTLHLIVFATSAPTTALAELTTTDEDLSIGESDDDKHVVTILGGLADTPDAGTYRWVLRDMSADGLVLAAGPAPCLAAPAGST